MEEKDLWGIVFAFSLILSAAVIYCISGNCFRETNAEIKDWIIFFLLSVIVFGSLFFFTRAWKKEKKVEEAKRNSFSPKSTEGLDEESKKVYELICARGGSVFQGELVKESGFSKVRVTRILDKLEMNGFIERKRRGLSNIVLAK